MTNDDSNAAPTFADGDRRLERVVAAVIRLAGVLAVFAGLAMATRNLVSGAYLVAMVDLIAAESDVSGPAALAASVGGSLTVAAWGVALFFLARPAARLIVKVR